MKTIYINMRSNYGIETVDQFEQEENQTLREFRKYVNEMVKEYRLSGMNVYKSQRKAKE